MNTWEIERTFAGSEPALCLSYGSLQPRIVVLPFVDDLMSVYRVVIHAHHHFGNRVRLYSHKYDIPKYGNEDAVRDALNHFKIWTENLLGHIRHVETTSPLSG